MIDILDINKKYIVKKASDDIITFENGIDFAKYKRRSQHCKDPILFRSALPLSHFMDKPGNSILGAIGHGFIQIPYSDAQLKAIIDSINPLNDIQLQDIIINFCHLRSAIRDSFHNFKGKLRAIMGKVITDIEKNTLLKAEFAKYRNTLVKEVGEHPDLISEFDRIISFYDDANISSIELIQATQEESLVRFLPNDNDDPEETIAIKRSWKILFLDDNPEELEDIFKLLDQRQIGYEKVTSYEAAKDCITNDPLNRITVIVSDYRLYQDGSDSFPSIMQSKQGYDFILWVSQQYRYNALVALSGLSKWFLLESFRKQNISVKIYSKNGLLGGGKRLFIDDLEYLGAQYNDIVNNQPTAKSWQDPIIRSGKVLSYELIRYYVYHRNSSNYLSFEDKINRDAEQIAREAEFAIDNNSLFNFGTTLSIYGGIMTNMKGDPSKDYNIFLKKLTIRRIFIYLQLKGFHKEAIVKLLHTGNMESDVSDSTIKQILFYLAIQSESDIPHNLLVEEKSFLMNIMHVPIYQLSDLINQAHVIINKVVNQQLEIFPGIARNIDNYLVYDQDSKKHIVESVSLFDAHVLIEKIVMALEDGGNKNYILSFINSLIDIFIDIHTISPKLNAIKETRDKLIELKQRTSK